MIERVSVGRRVGIVIAICGLHLLACAEAHDVDAVREELSDEDASTDEGSSVAGSGNAGRGSAGRGSDDAGSANAGRGSDDAGSSGGTAGDDGAAGAAGNGGGTGEPIFDDVSSCAPCEGAMGSMGELEPCCTAAGQCGVDIGGLNGLGPTCARKNAPGTESMSCPGYVFQGNFMLTSCCGADGLCGVQIMQTAPLGCIDPALLGDLVMEADGMMSGGGMMFGGGFGQGQGQGQDNSGERESCGAMVD